MQIHLSLQEIQKREIEEYGGVEKAEEDMLYQQQKQMNLQEEIAQLEYIIQLKKRRRRFR